MTHATTVKQENGQYRLVLSAEAKLAGFYNLAGLTFDRYRPAQDLANAVKEHMDKKETKAADAAE